MRYLPHWTVRNISAAAPPKLLKLCRRAAWRELTESSREPLLESEALLRRKLWK